MRYLSCFLETLFKYTANSGFLHWSPPSPTIHGYPSTFQWLVRVSKGYFIVFTVTQVLACGEGLLKIYDGGSDKAALLATNCDSTLLTEFNVSSTANLLCVTLSAGNAYLSTLATRPGFLAMYNAQKIPLEGTVHYNS